MEFSHVSVLLKETVDGAFTDPKGVYADLTTGGGGHSLELAKRLDGGRLICFDQDKEALEAAGERLKGLPVTFVRSNFCEMKSVLADLGIKELDGIIADLGVSSHQLDTAERGFSFHNDAPLDMRMSGEGLSARDVVNEYDEGELAKILFDYGEEKFGNRIARGIVNARLTAPIETTGQLAEIIKSSVPAAYRREKNPCRKSFQAIRIEVNHELDVLETALTDGFDVLKVGGRMSVITFHSLEDRIVKNRFKEFCTGCTCPPEFPVCVCGRKPMGRLVDKKPITASPEELERNPRSRSAKLRIIEKIRRSPLED
ncbi:MAG TPA: 16S rRNA (cytosine(1402)-N(4))-methyltransferase [Ruminococcaceae bacterium]|mgnify:CR=1 FL=1|jgi:16S rRNA (cytosine1402-N4)-methyltransferase|nr:16S rRNA (cytosine(1402)-N(4))-methyltransferase [Oscillospiraceae bacterium]HCK49305.1 16S rRNA (cytosine(1402)-N(4))-methyltransferase [Oscillospiraceae bacterium]